MCAPTEIESDPDGQKVSTFTKPIFSYSFQSENSNSYSSQTHKFHRPHRTLFKPTKTLKSSQKCMCLATKIESDTDGQKGQRERERARERAMLLEKEGKLFHCWGRPGGLKTEEAGRPGRREKAFFFFHSAPEQ
jgi:hypothetical protein